MRILVVDDNPAVRRGIRSLLSEHPEWSVCAEASDGIEAVEKAKELRPNIVLMDISMPRLDGLAATRIIQQELPASKVIIVSQNDPALLRGQSNLVGASAWIPKHRLDSDLVPCIEKNSNGHSIAAHEAVSPTWFAGEGEMNALMRSTDWSQTPLGTPQTWTPALQMMVKFMLANRFPQLLWWGPQFCSLYNDAYVPILGTKHPWALGRPVSEVWKEIWHILKPLIETPYNGGPATWMEDIPLEINRRGFFEETHFTVAYSPVPDNTVASGIGGVLATVHEITEKVIGERRVHALRDLGAHSIESKSAEEACKIVAGILSRDPKDIPFLLLYLFDPSQRKAHLASTVGVDSEDRGCPKVIDLTRDGDEVWPVSALVAEKELQWVRDLTGKFQRPPKGPWSDSPSSAAVVPVRSNIQRELAGFMIVGLSARLQFDKACRDFLELMSTQIATVVANASAYEGERKRSEALAEIDRAKTVFFSNVSHEFRTPLTLMLGPLQDLLSRSEAHLSSTAKDQLELVNRNGTRLLRLVNTLLDFSRIEAGRAQGMYVATDLAALTTELASTFRSATERAGLRLSVDCREIGEPVYVDSDFWEKIVLNLLSNAFKFTFDGEIAVTLERVGSDSELRVRDTGVGIPAEEMPKLFERFHRIPNARSRTFEGTGIGLALVQELVKLHGGSIHAESAAGLGTTFIVRIPLGQSHLPAGQVGGSRSLSSTAVGAAPFVEEALRWLPTTDDAEETALPIERELLPISTRRVEAEDVPRMRVLVADDNADMRHYLVRLLQGEYEVESVADGQAAISAIQRKTPDLVLSDVMMPIMDGFALLKAVRADQRTRTTPVILLSARAGEESRVEGLEKGADDYLVKPFSARELVARVQAHLELAQVRRETDRAIRENEEQLRTEVRNRTRDLEARNAEILAQADQVRELSVRLLQSQDEERKRIARELHDSAGQTLAALSIEQARIAKHLAQTPQAAKHMKEIQNLTAQLTREIRTTSYLLHPPMLEDGGLAIALRSYLDGLAARGPLEVDLRVAENFGRLPEAAELTIFRIVQEALTNIHRHSGSRDAIISLGREGHKVSLAIEDHGTGMSAEKLAEVQTHGGGVGIRGMRERIRQLNGEFAIESGPTGTKLSAHIPLENVQSRSESEMVRVAAQSDG